MFGKGWKLMSVFGIPIRVDTSWLVILALLTLSLAGVFPSLMQTYFQGAAPELGAGSYWIMALITAVAFFACIVLHELGHAIAGRSQAMSIRGITLFLFGGVAEIGDEPPSARAEFIMAIAGPLVSVVLGAIAALLSWVGYLAHWPAAVVLVLGYLAFINLLVLCFNLVPAFPLDGGRVLRSILWGITGNLRRATYLASMAGVAFAWVLIFWGVLQFFVGNWFGGIWLGLIGLFLKNAAQSGYQQVLVKQALRGESIKRFMTSNPIVVSPYLNLHDWVEEYVYRHHRKAFPVVSSEGKLEGCIETQALLGIPRAEWEHHTVAELMTHDLTDLVISPETDALEALGKMQRKGSSRLLVTEGEHLVGILSLKDLLQFLSLKIELEGEDGEGWGGEFVPVSRTTEADKKESIHSH